VVDILLFFFATFLASFLGTIPPGVVNLTAIRIGAEKGIRESVLFSAGYTVIEMIYGLIAIFIIQAFSEYISQIELVIKVISVPILIGFGYSMMKTKVNTEQDAAEEIKKKGSHYFRFGLKLGILNPMALPYWITFCALSISMFNNFAPIELITFEIGLGLGAYALLVLYALGGVSIKKFLSENGVALNKWLGWIFIILAFLQCAYIVYSEFFESN
jgi:threonine/homoserine/homoserine lactone efflux protein